MKILSQRWAGMEGLVFSADGHTLAVDSTGLSIWDVRSGRELAVLPNLSWSDHASLPEEIGSPVSLLPVIGSS